MDYKQLDDKQLEIGQLVNGRLDSGNGQLDNWTMYNGKYTFKH